MKMRKRDYLVVFLEARNLKAHVAVIYRLKKCRRKVLIIKVLRIQCTLKMILASNSLYFENKKYYALLNLGGYFIAGKY